MATSTPSPTPSEDNRQNNRDDNMYSALDKIMGNSVQSYEDFLNSFTFLKTGMQVDQKMNKSTDKRKKTNLLTSSENRIEHVEESYKVNKDIPVMLAESHDIEEEILCEGDTTSRMNKIKVIKTGALVKFDNFVDPVADGDDVDIEDNISTAGYSASFSSGNSTRNSTAGRRIDTVTETVDTVKVRSNYNHNNDTDILNTHLSLDEKSTDKLLLNFLADLQNEQNEQNPNIGSHTEASSSEMDIQNFLQKNKKSRKHNISEVEEVHIDSGEVNFSIDDDDDDDALNLLCDDSETNDVKVKITNDELRKMNAADHKAKSTLDNIYKSSLLDSEGNIQIVKIDEKVTEHGTVNEAVDYDKIVFPGQVEEKNDEPGVENNRLLDFTATLSEISVNTDIQVESTNLVQPFKLDDDFDYDNVVLKPKFSSEDLRQLKITVKSQTVVM